MIKEINEYLRDVMKKILDSYSIVENLSNSSADLELLQMELKKINGLLLVLNKKLTQLKDQSNNFEDLNKKIIFYFANYDFAREIQLLSNTYSEDTLRVRNIRNSVVDSLKHGKLIDKIYEMSKSI
mgnify:FL=1|tara:strand:+ start:1635 stop:2012 length:378 start_codon:yes stop_codon:yes gene_type:complete